MAKELIKGNRKRPSHFDGQGKLGRPTIQFVTLCTQDREPILANDAVHKTIVEAWKIADHWLVGRYVIMPDHIHLFVAPASIESLSLQKWMAYWRAHASQHWPNPQESPIWQRDYWDRVLRSNESYDAKWEYVCANPVRAGLVSEADDWPFQGELNELRW